MKKILYIIISIMCLSCSLRNQSGNYSSKDSVVIMTLGYNINLSIDSFLQVKDSFVYCKEEKCWMTKECYKWNYGYPDTIKVAFTRNGVLEDSVEAVRQGIINDSTGRPYSPAYVFFSTVGDSWVYDADGKYIGFNKSPYPHSGNGINYKP